MATSQQIAAFIDTIAPLAQRVQDRYGVPASLVIAQAALETGWGESVIGGNYFGIKGKGIDAQTLECIGGKLVSVRDSFARHGGLDASCEAYGNLLASNARYAAVGKSESGIEAAEAVAKAGYATDPNYASKLKDIIRQHQLTRFDDPARYQTSYLSDGKFDEYDRRLASQRQENPGDWLEMLKQLAAGLISAIGSFVTQMFGGPPTTPALPVKPSVPLRG